MKTKTFFYSSLTLVSLHVVTPSVAQSTKPNVIFILADDIGYSDFGCYGAKKIKTPVMDKIARRGVKFTNAYAPASTSSPSRYALLTGEYAWRKKVGVLPADAPLTIDINKLTLPKMFQQAGYYTGIVGKWHLGLGKKDKVVNFNKEIEHGPRSVGFEYSFYFPATNDRVPCIFIENEKTVNLDINDPIEVSYRKKVGNDPTGLENPELLTLPLHMGHNQTIVNGVSRIGYMSGGNSARWKDETMAKEMCDKAISFINKQQSEPFFLYYAPHNAHEPRIPSAKFRGKSKAGIYGDVIEEFDYYVGVLVKELKEKGLYDNTLIVISSDNGPMIKEAYDDGAFENLNGHDPFGGFRGEKNSLYEAGMRVPLLFSWPDRVKKAFVQDQPFSYLDMLATFSGLLNLSIENIDYNDSKDGAALFLQKNAPDYREYIMTQNNGGDKAIRQGIWKFYPAKNGRWAELYNLKTDASELHSLLFTYPEKVKELSSLINKY